MMKILILISVFKVIYGGIIREEISTIGIQNASRSDSPWYALILIDKLRCGGSLVNNDFVVTAAHCFDSFDRIDESSLKSKILIKFGEWRTDITEDCEEQVCETVAEIQPKSVKIHESYQKNGKNKHLYDIAVIKLAWSPRQSEYMRNINLSNYDCGVNLSNQLFTVFGFGETKERRYSNIKKKIQINVFSSRFCKTKYEDTFDRSKHICGLGYEGVTTCSGDSGSGLVRSENGTTYLEGITVYGVANCGERDTPSGFMKVACFKEWIEEQFRVLSKN